MTPAEIIKRKVQEYWLDIATPYGDPCDFIHIEDPYEKAKRTNTHPCISATNIHVIEYSAYERQAKIILVLSEALDSINKLDGHPEDFFETVLVDIIPEALQQVANILNGDE